MKSHRVIIRPDIIGALEETETITKQRRVKIQQNNLSPDERDLSTMKVKDNDKKDAMDIPERPS